MYLTAMDGAHHEVEDGLGETWDKEHDGGQARGRFTDPDQCTGRTSVKYQQREASGALPDECSVPMVLTTQLNEQH